LIALAFVAFVSLGLPDCVLGVAWPSIRETFGRPLGHLGQILAVGTGAYLLSSFLAGQLLRAVGVGKLLVGSSLLVAGSLAGYAMAPGWPVVLAAAAAGGLGAGAIDAGINTVAAARFSPRVVNWLHASWGVGATAGPLLMTAVLAIGHGWRLGYGILTVAIVALAVLFAMTIRLWEAGDEPPPAAAGGTPRVEAATALEALRRPVVGVQAVLFFVYGGIETTAGQLLFTLFTESRGVGVTAAGVTVGAYWASLTLGRIVFGQLAVRWSRRAVLRAGMALAPVAAALLAWDVADAVSFGGAALLGFALAPVFPTLISVTPGRVGPRYAGQAVGFQIAAGAIGIAVFPGVVAGLARRHGLELVCAYLVAAPLVLFALHEVAMRLTRGGDAEAEAAPAPAAPAAVTP
jgi:fucose permease